MYLGFPNCCVDTRFRHRCFQVAVGRWAKWRVYVGWSLDGDESWGLTLLLPSGNIALECFGKATNFGRLDKTSI